MVRCLLTLGVLFALFAMFTPTATAQASTMNADFYAVVQAGIDADNPAGVTLDAKQGPQFDDMACRPFRAIGRGLRGLGRGIGRAFGQSC